MTYDRPQIDWTDLRLRGLLDALGLEAGIYDIAAIGWATVELDRAETSLAADFQTTFEPADRDTLLGATVRRSTGKEPRILLLEPDTEGRLAGALARHGEGPLALYLRGASGAQKEPPNTRLGSGPFGPERLVLDGSPAGPFLILVEPAEPATDPATGPAPENTDRVPSEP